MEINVTQYLIDLLLGHSSLRDIVGPHQLLLVEQSVVRIVDYLEGLQVDPLASIGYYLRGHQF